MFMLRLLAILCGGIVLVASPLYLRAQGTLRGEDTDLVVRGCLLMGTIAISFFYIGLAGYRMRRSRKLRAIGGALLGVPLITAVVMVTETRYLQAVYLCVLMFCMAAILFASFVYPGGRIRKHRPMRPRDAQPEFPNQP
jgi:glucose dehydrogenase